VKLLAIAAIVILTLSGCTPAAKSGAPKPATTTVRVLTIAHIDGGEALDPAVVWFASALEARSRGRLTVETKYSCCGRDADVEKVLVGQVADGESDLGWVGASAFHGLGVTAFDPLVAPMLLKTYGEEEAVLESNQAASLLPYLAPLGVEGVSVMPGALRYPLSKSHPITSLADWKAVPFYVFPSEIGESSIHLLGAKVTTGGFDERDNGVNDGSIAALDNSMLFQSDDKVPWLPYVTLNVPLWARISVLIESPELQDSLSPEQKGWLIAAATDTIWRTHEFTAIDESAVSQSCVHGAKISYATDRDLLDIQHALAPATASIASNKKDAATLENFREIVRSNDDSATARRAKCSA
jgi:TRAP-type transport system periplasmic protein